MSLGVGGTAGSRAKWAACDGLLAGEICILGWFDGGDAEEGVLVGDTLVLRLESSILVEFTGETGSNVVGAGRRSGRLVVSESGDRPHGGYEGVCARRGYDGICAR